MKTESTQFPDESRANLFRNLFLVRIDLENHTDERLFRYQNEVTLLIESIDQLLQFVIDDLSE